jgi:hypothetical protein
MNNLFAEDFFKSNELDLDTGLLKSKMNHKYIRKEGDHYIYKDKQSTEKKIDKKIDKEYENEAKTKNKLNKKGLSFKKQYKENKQRNNPYSSLNLKRNKINKEGD